MVPRPGRGRVVAALVVSVGLLTACSDDDGDAAPLAPSTTAGVAEPVTADQFEATGTVAVWFEAGVADGDVDAVRTAIDDLADVEDVRFVGPEETFAEFQELFADEPQLIEAVSPEILPPSLRFTVPDPRADEVQEWTAGIEGRPGVRDVTIQLDVGDLPRSLPFPEPGDEGS